MLQNIYRYVYTIHIYIAYVLLKSFVVIRVSTFFGSFNNKKLVFVINYCAVGIILICHVAGFAVSKGLTQRIVVVISRFPFFCVIIIIIQRPNFNY